MPTLIKQQFFGGHFAMHVSPFELDDVKQRMQDGYLSHVYIDNSNNKGTIPEIMNISKKDIKTMLEKPISIFWALDTHFSSFFHYMSHHTFTSITDVDYEVLKKHADDVQFFGKFHTFEYGECVQYTD